MTESFVTQCPHCQTRFRVTRAQLGMARGAVRCGACLQVFNAAEQLAQAEQQGTPSPAPSKPMAGTAAPTPPTPPADLRSALGAAAAAAAPGAVASVLSGAAAQPASPTAKPAPAAAKPVEPPAPPAATTPLVDETLWIHDDLDLDNLDLDLDDELDALELSDELSDYSAAQAANAAAADNPPARHDESWAEALLNEPAAPAKPASAPAARPIDEPSPELEDVDENFPELDDDAEEAARHAPDALVAQRDEPISVSAAAAALGATATRRSEPRLRDEGLLSLNDEPLQLDWQPQQGPGWTRRLLWALLILLALAGLAAQYAWYHFDELARHERLRPWFDKACPLLGCQLPPLVDVNLVKSSNLTVRNHPTHPGALTVDAIIYNRADFAQPFPLLELRFEDINGQLLASRSFRPSEYLAGELAGRSDMPPQTPIHIALEIVDPGTRAVNYRLSFHSPD